MQWDDSPTAGFTSAHPWINIPPSASRINVAAQVQDPGSILSYYKALIEARHRIPALTDGTFDRIDVGDPALFTYCRRTSCSEVLVMVNLSGTARAPHFPSPDEAWTPSRWTLYLGNVDEPRAGGSPDGQNEEDCFLPPCASMRPWEARVYVRAPSAPRDQKRFSGRLSVSR